MKKRLKRWTLQAFAWTLLTIAALGFPIPFFPTTLLIIIGLLILSPQYDWARRWLDKLKTKFPKLTVVIDRFERTFGTPADESN